MRPPGPLEIVLIIVVLLIVFGVGKLPQVSEFFGNTVGKGVAKLRGKKSTSSDSQEDTQTKKRKKVIRKLE